MARKGPRRQYGKKLLDPRWQKKRLEAFERDEWHCQRCYGNELTLHVHHRWYVGEPWEAPMRALMTLCEECHADETERRPLAERELTETLKIDFMTDEIEELAQAFLWRSAQDLKHEPSVMMSAICRVIEDDERFRAAIDDYFQWLRTGEWRAKRNKAEEDPPDAP